MIPQASSILHFRFRPSHLPSPVLPNSLHQDAAWREGLRLEVGRRPRSCRQIFKQRCRCARSHAPLAARAPFPPPSVALITPPSTEVHSNRPLQLLPLPRSSRWRLTRATPQYVYQPHQPHQPGSHRRSSASRCCAPMRTCTPARPHNLRCGAGCRGDFGRTDRVGLAAACDAGLAAVRPPLHPSRACARFDRPSTRPLSAVRRCQHGCECQRCWRLCVGSRRGYQAGIPPPPPPLHRDTYHTSDLHSTLKCGTLSGRS